MEDLKSSNPVGSVVAKETDVVSAVASVSLIGQSPQADQQLTMFHFERVGNLVSMTWATTNLVAEGSKPFYATIIPQEFRPKSTKTFPIILIAFSSSSSTIAEMSVDCEGKATFYSSPSGNTFQGKCVLLSSTVTWNCVI